MKGSIYKKILAVSLAVSLSATAASSSILASDTCHVSEIEQDAETDMGNGTVSDDTPLGNLEDLTPADTKNEENNAQINFSGQENLYESMEIAPERAGDDIESEKTVKSIEVKKKPDKMTYLTARDDNIDLYGMELSITYTDETTDTISINEHTDRFEVNNGGTVTSFLYGDVNKRVLHIDYGNGSCEITLEKPDWEAESSQIEDEKIYPTDLTEKEPCHIYSFCPSETKTYNFFSFSDTSVGTFVELYERDGNDYKDIDSDGGGGGNNKFLLSQTLNANTNYYFIVSHRDFGTPAKFTCCLSSTISSLSQLTVTNLEVTKASKDIYYDFESDSIPVGELNIKGTEYKATYSNGWERAGKVEQGGAEAEILGKTLSVRWKYTTTDEFGKSFADKDRDDNALIYTYEDHTTEFPVTFNAPSPVKSISIEGNPWQNWKPYQYQLVGNEGKTNWPSVQVSVKIQYNDGRGEETVTWPAGEAGYEEEYNGYWIRVRLREGADIQPGENAVVVSYMGKSDEVPITVMEDPVESIQILQQPEKTEYYPFEESVDLCGMKAQIVYRNGKNLTVEVSEHTDSHIVPDTAGYGGKLTSSLDSSKKVSISYIGYTEELTSCKKRGFTAEDSISLTEGEEKQTGLSEGPTYQIFSFTPSESAAYQFSWAAAIVGNWSIARLYNAANSELVYAYSGNNGLNYEMVGGRIYYIALINDSKSKQDIIYSINRQEATPKEDISGLSLSVDAPSAGNVLPDLTEIESEHYYISDCRWLNDENDDNIADYGKKHQFEAVLRAKAAHQFTSSTEVEVNGEKITEKSMGSDGDLTIRYTFPSFTQFQITIPQAEGYTLDESQNPVPGEAEQGESYTFRYIKNTENDSIKLIVKAGDTVLTPAEDGTYVIENITQNITVTVKQVNISADSDESILTLYDRSAVRDVLTGKRNTRLADNENGDRTLPVLESSPDGSDQFFFGWYQDKDQDLNGKGTRFTSQSILAEPQYSLYARWGKGTFSYKSDQEDVNCKILSIDESDGIKVEIGKISPSEDGTIQIPEKIDWSENEDLKSLGIEFSHCSVTAISDNAFSGDTAIKHVSLPDTLEKIGENAFKGCTGLQEISIPASVDTVPKGAFQGCTSLTCVRLEEGVTKIDASAFNGCDSLQTVVLPDSIEEVHENAFDRNEKIELVCSSHKKDSPVIKAVENITGASAVTIDVEIDPPSAQMQFTYGGPGKTFTASVCVDGKADEERRITWKYPVTQAYLFDVNEKENSLTVTPVQVTAEGEAVVIQAVDEKSGKYRSVTLTTKADDDHNPVVPSTVPTDTPSITPAPSMTPIPTGTITPVPQPKASQILKNRYDSKGKRLKVMAGSRLTQVVTGAKTNVTFTSSDSKVAKVGKTTGVIRFVGAGKAVITAKAAETKEYRAASKKATFYVVPRTAAVKSLKSNKKGRVTIKGSNGAKDNSGYQILYKHNGKTRKVSVKGRKSVTKTIKKLKSGKAFKVKIRAYKKVDGVTYYGKYGKWKTLKRVR